MLNTVISGFQSGSDIAGIIAAKHCGLKTRGWMPRGFKTEQGNYPVFAELFGAVETPSDGYGQRTDWNVRDSDATILVAQYWNSPGTVMTKKVCKNYGKPFFCVTYQPPSRIRDHEEHVIDWLVNKDIYVLNVAGNRESVSPGIKVWTTRLLIDVFHTMLLEE